MVTSDAFSREKRDHMRALGARVVEIASDGGRITRELIQGMMARAADLCESPDHVLADQYNNPDASVGYRPLAREILEDTDGRVDAFVQAVGTAQCIIGVESALRASVRGVRIVAVEPPNRRCFPGERREGTGSRGSARASSPPLWEEDVAVEIVAVPTGDAKAMSRRLAKEEALFAGTSSGANVLAALAVAERLGPDSTVVTLLCDSGLDYLSTDLYS